MPRPVPTSRRSILLAAVVLAALAAAGAGRAAALQHGGPATRPAARKPVALVTGANRGLGLAFARQLSAGGWRVIGTARTPTEAEDLRKTGADVVQLDVADPASVAQLARTLGRQPVDLLINNAGMGTGQRSGSIADVDFETAERVLRVNTLGPMRVVQALLPNLRRGDRKLVVNISSRLGSIELSTSAGYYGYRESKAALNMFTRTLAAELKPEGFVCITMSPGWVRTRMGGDAAPLSPEESIGGMLKVVAGLKPEDTGSYFNHAGDRLPW